MSHRNSLSLAICLAAVGVAQAQEEIKDGKTYVNGSMKLTLSIPSADWGTLRAGKDLEWKWPGDLCEFLDAKGNLGGILTAETSSMKNEDYAKHFEEDMAKHEGSKKFERKPGFPKKLDDDRIRVEYTWEYKEWTFDYVAVFFTKDKFNGKLCLWIESRLRADYDAALNGIADSLKSTDSGGTGTETGGTKVEHPWAKCGEGSWVEHQISTQMSGSDSEMSSKRTLVKKTADELTFKLESKMTKPTAMDMPATESKEKLLLEGSSGTGGTGSAKELGKGDEDLEVAGKKLKCKWVETEMEMSGKKTTSKVWTCDDVPGAVVKSVTKNADMTSSMLLTGFEKK